MEYPWLSTQRELTGLNTMAAPPSAPTPKNTPDGKPVDRSIFSASNAGNMELISLERAVNRLLYQLELDMSGMSQEQETWSSLPLQQLLELADQLNRLSKGVKLASTQLVTLLNEWEQRSARKRNF